MININCGFYTFTDIYIYGGLLKTLNQADISRGILVFVFYPLTTDGKTGYPAWVADKAAGAVFDLSMYPMYLKITCNKSYWVDWWNMKEPKTTQLFFIKVLIRTAAAQETLFEFYSPVNLYREQNSPINAVSSTSNKYFYP